MTCIKNSGAILCLHDSAVADAPRIKMKYLPKAVCLLSVCVVMAGTAAAQDYVAVDLGVASPTSIAGGLGGGALGSGVSAHATTWDLLGRATDIHPAFLASATAQSYSAITGMGGDLMCGYGVGDITSGKVVALVWEAGVPRTLATPMTTMYQYPAATDGTQVVGYIYPQDLAGELTTFGTMRAVIWNPSTGGFIDLSGGNNPAAALGVGGGQQVGYEVRSKGAEARLWSGTSRSMINLHPKAYVVSQANATDGIRQVGSVSLDLQVFAEKRGRRRRFNYAAAWQGSASTFTPLYSGFTESNALAVRGDTIVGNGVMTDRYGTDLYSHALLWTGPLNSVVDLHSMLPATAVNSRAVSIDAAGNIIGTWSAANGKPHGVIWVKQ